MIDIDKIEAAARAATPGPWEAAGPSFGDPLPMYLNCVGYVTEDDEFEDVCTAPNEHDGASTSDMAFIATANPAAVLEMVSMIRERDAVLRQALEALEDAMTLTGGWPGCRKAIAAIKGVLEP